MFSFSSFRALDRNQGKGTFACPRASLEACSLGPSFRKSVSIYPRSASENSRRSSLVLTMTHERKGLTILKGAKSCEAKRTTADEESRLPRRFEPVKLQVFPPPPVRTFKRIYRAKIRICHLRKNIIPSPRMILCLRRIDLTRCPADEICKRFLIL